MADDVEIRIDGLSALIDDLKRFPEELRLKEVKAGVQAGAEVVRAAAAARAPVLKVPDARRIRGNLQRNIVKRIVENDPFMIRASVGVRKLTGKQVAALKRRARAKGAASTSDAFYWRFPEFGTSKMPAQPFLRPAFDDNVDRIIDAFTERLNAGIDRLNAK
jgi:HK97 gp10 family phage protein